MDEGGEKALEEERRLAYVGITRGRKHVIISCAANRRIYGNWTSSIPSRFIDELPPEHVEVEGGARPRATEQPSMFNAAPMFARRPRVIEAPAWEVKERAPRPDAIKVGQRVFHMKFGNGNVIAVDDDKLDIEFDKAGTKRVLDRFVEKVG
jgi:DNA helicase-2/ATP-dependent DNA helicase PcrA